MLIFKIEFFGNHEHTVIAEVTTGIMQNLKITDCIYDPYRTISINYKLVNIISDISQNVILGIIKSPLTNNSCFFLSGKRTPNDDVVTIYRFDSSIIDHIYNTKNFISRHLKYLANNSNHLYNNTFKSILSEFSLDHSLDHLEMYGMVSVNTRHFYHDIIGHIELINAFDCVTKKTAIYIKFNQYNPNNGDWAIIEDILKNILKNHTIEKYYRVLNININHLMIPI